MEPTHGGAGGGSPSPARSRHTRERSRTRAAAAPFRPSCGKKRSLLWAERLREEVLEAVPHRHVVVTIPRLLRPLFRRRRELLRDLAQSTAEALCAFVCESLGEGLRPGVVVSIVTSHPGR